MNDGTRHTWAIWSPRRILLTNGSPASTPSCDFTNDQTGAFSPGGSVCLSPILSPLPGYGLVIGRCRPPYEHRLSETCRCRFPERDPGPAVRLSHLCAVFCAPVLMHKTVEPLSRRSERRRPSDDGFLSSLVSMTEPYQYMALVPHLRSLTASRLPSEEFENDHGSS